MKHVHAEVIHAWANGEPIQWRIPHVDETWRDWKDEDMPSFRQEYEYRLKPEEDEFVTVDRFAYYNQGIDRVILQDGNLYPPNLRLTFNKQGMLVGVDQLDLKWG